MTTYIFQNKYFTPNHLNIRKSEKPHSLNSVHLNLKLRYSECSRSMVRSERELLIQQMRHRLNDHLSKGFLTNVSSTMTLPPLHDNYVLQIEWLPAISKEVIKCSPNTNMA